MGYISGSCRNSEVHARPKTMLLNPTILQDDFANKNIVLMDQTLA